MARRYFYEFRTLLGKYVTVNIYDRDFTGTAIELDKDVPNSPGMPTDNPVVIEEDDSTNMLDVIRTKTGYLNFVELTDGGLAPLYAKDNTQIEVQIRVSGYLIFQGYVQAQTFDSEWMSHRRKVKIPIQSYMETMDNKQISDCESMGVTSFGEIIESDFSRYSNIIIPELDTEDIDYQSIHPLEMLCLNRTLSPYNDDYNFGVLLDGVIPDVYNSLTMREFLENLCKLYGLVAHDVAQNILLTRADFWGNYLKVETGEASHAGEESTVIGSSTNVIQFYDYFQIGSDDNKIKTENPLSKIHINVDEVPDKVEIDLSQSTYANFTDNAKRVALQLQNDEVQSTYMTSQSGALSGTMVRVEGDSSKEMLHVVANTYDVILFRCFFETKRMSVLNRLIVEAELEHDDEEMYVAVYSGGKYYNYGSEGDQWITTPSYKDLTFDNGKAEIEVDHNGPTVEVRFYAKNMIYTHGWDVLFKSIRLEWVTVENPYLYYRHRDTNYILRKGDIASFEEESIDSEFYHSLYGYVSTPQYGYMLQSQQVLTITARNTTIIDDTTLYMSKMQIGTDATLWRVVAISRNLINDEYTLTLMHSDLTETLTPPNS